MVLTGANILRMLAIQLWWSFLGVRCCTGPIVAPITNPQQFEAEGPHWDVETQVLFFVDPKGGLINRYDPSTNQVTHAEFPGTPVSIIIPVNGTKAKQFLVTRGHDIVLVNWNYENVTFENSINDKNVSIITSVETEYHRTERWNDGKADAKGRLWAGTIGPSRELGIVILDQAAFYRLDPNSTTAVIVEQPVTNSNGLIWNEDNTLLYYIDSLTYQIDVFDFDLDIGSISNRRKVFNLKENNVPGIPDGMTIDNKGNLWIACFFGRRIINVDPRTGTLIRSVEIPADQVTSLMFGGSNLDILYVTTGRLQLTEQQLQEQPLAGSVFSVTCLGVKALAPAHNIIRTAA